MKIKWSEICMDCPFHLIDTSYNYAKTLQKITKKHYPNQTIEKNEIGHGNQRNVIATVFLGSTSYFFLTKNLQIF